MDFSNITKKEFNERILRPLYEELGIRIEFNSQDIKNEGYNMGSRYVGMTFQDGTIVLLWQKDRNLTMSTLFHEIGHTLLHRDSKVRRMVPSKLREVEAEMFSTMFMKEFNINLNGKNERYIERHQRIYDNYCKKIGCEPKSIRQDKIEQIYLKILPVAKKIIDNLKK